MQKPLKQQTENHWLSVCCKAVVAILFIFLHIIYLSAADINLKMHRFSNRLVSNIISSQIWCFPFEKLNVCTTLTSGQVVSVVAECSTFVSILVDSKLSKQTQNPSTKAHLWFCQQIRQRSQKGFLSIKRLQRMLQKRYFYLKLI